MFQKGDIITITDMDRTSVGTVVRSSAASYDVNVGGSIWRFWSRPANFAVGKFIRYAA